MKGEVIQKADKQSQVSVLVAMKVDKESQVEVYTEEKGVSALILVQAQRKADVDIEIDKESVPEYEEGA